MERREYLGALALATVGSLAGCGGIGRSSRVRTVEFRTASGDGSGSDLVVSHDRERATTFEIRVLEQDTGETRRGTVTVPADGFGAYHGVFEDGGDHTVWVRVEGHRQVTDVHNSATNSLWVTYRDGELSLDLGEA